jgi:hypothetical protein
MRRFIFAILIIRDLGDQIENNELGRVCSKYRRQERCIHGSGGKTFRGHFEKLFVDGTMILKWMLKK